MPVLYLWNHSFALSTSSEPFSRHAWQIIAPAACRLLACFTSLVEHPCSIFRARIYKKREKKREKKKKLCPISFSLANHQVYFNTPGSMHEGFTKYLPGRDTIQPRVPASSACGCPFFLSFSSPLFLDIFFFISTQLIYYTTFHANQFHDQNPQTFTKTPPCSPGSCSAS